MRGFVCRQLDAVGIRRSRRQFRRHALWPAVPDGELCHADGEPVHALRDSALHGICARPGREHERRRAASGIVRHGAGNGNAGRRKRLAEAHRSRHGIEAHEPDVPDNGVSLRNRVDGAESGYDRRSGELKRQVGVSVDNEVVPAVGPGHCLAKLRMPVDGHGRAEERRAVAVKDAPPDDGDAGRHNGIGIHARLDGVRPGIEESGSLGEDRRLPIGQRRRGKRRRDRQLRGGRLAAGFPAVARVRAAVPAEPGDGIRHPVSIVVGVDPGHLEEAEAADPAHRAVGQAFGGAESPEIGPASVFQRNLAEEPHAAPLRHIGPEERRLRVRADAEVGERRRFWAKPGRQLGAESRRESRSAQAGVVRRQARAPVVGKGRTERLHRQADEHPEKT